MNFKIKLDFNNHHVLYVIVDEDTSVEYEVSLLRDDKGFIDRIRVLNMTTRYVERPSELVLNIAKAIEKDDKERLKNSEKEN